MADGTRVINAVWSEDNHLVMCAVEPFISSAHGASVVMVEQEVAERFQAQRDQAIEVLKEYMAGEHYTGLQPDLERRQRALAVLKDCGNAADG